MGSIFLDEGIDKIFSIFPKDGTNLSTLYLGLFTSQSASTVPARTATGGASPSGITEMAATGGYARIAIASSDWGAESTSGNGRKISTSAAKTFTNSNAIGGTAWSAANGFFLATQSASGAGDTLIYAANFDSGQQRILQGQDTLDITPSMIFMGA